MFPSAFLEFIVPDMFASGLTTTQIWLGVPLAILFWLVLVPYLLYRIGKGVFVSVTRPKISRDVAKKAKAFKEVSFGWYRVNLILSNGQRIPAVIADSGAIQEIRGSVVGSDEDLDFNPQAVVDVVGD